MFRQGLRSCGVCVGGAAFFGRLEHHPEDWASYSTLTHLRICEAAERITKEHLIQIFRLYSLEHLQLSHKGSATDTAIDTDIDIPPVRLENLHTLDLEVFWLSNGLVLECPRMHTLRLDDVYLHGRVALAACTQLRSLSFSCCELEGGAAGDWLGPELLHVQGLTALCLHGCMQHEVPPQAVSMSALKQLDLASNHIATLPAALPLLESLDLSGNEFSEVPEIPTAVTSLTMLDLSQQDFDCQVTRSLLPLLQSNPGLRFLAVGGGERWSRRSLQLLTEAWQWLDAQGRKLTFCYELQRDRRPAVAQ